MKLIELIKENQEFSISVKAKELKELFEEIAKSKKSDEAKKEEPASKLLTAENVCKMLSISRVTLWDWDKKGITKPIRLGNLKRYQQSDIEQLIQKKGGENETH